MSPVGLRRRIGRLVILGFEGESIPAELRSLARDFGLGGVILLGRNRNIVEPEQVAELCYEAAGLDPELPAWVSVDQEGGRVARLKSPFTEWPPMAALGRSGDLRLAERFARALASELRAVGVTLNYAPVLDVHTNPRNAVIGDRALGDEATEVARFGAVIIKALQAGHVAACGKHFPGHGDTVADSHVELPLVEHPPDRLRAVELVPFRAAIEAGVATIMTAHVLAPALDDRRPATLSESIVTDLLRREMKYEGVVLSDDLEMKAVADTYTVPEAAVLAIGAGCDGVLICGSNHHLQAQALEALIHGVEDERLPLGRLEDALARQRRAKEMFLPPAPSSRPRGSKALRQILGRDEHQAIAHEMARFA